MEIEVLCFGAQRPQEGEMLPCGPRQVTSWVPAFRAESSKFQEISRLRN